MSAIPLITTTNPQPCYASRDALRATRKELMFCLKEHYSISWNCGEKHMKDAVGFVGLGVMGELMCRNLALKSGRRMYGLDKFPEPLERLATAGVEDAVSLTGLAELCGTIFLSLPTGEHVEEVCLSTDGLLSVLKAGQTVVDMSTSPVDLTRRIGREFQDRGVLFADAPIARTRQAAEAGTLAITVGGDSSTFAAIRPLLDCIGTDVTHCGPVGSGQIIKLLNNMVMMETGAAISEALAIGQRAGLDRALLFDALSKGSADSFTLRNHGMNAMLPRDFPERAFSAIYAHKDLGYVLALAADMGVVAEGAQYVDRLLVRAIAAGDGEQYWPVISTHIGIEGLRHD